MSRRLIDLTEQRFGRLVVIERDVAPRYPGTFWWCLCDCGNRTSVESPSLRKNNNTRSCGCYRHESATKQMTTHGGRDTEEYSIWCNMRKRCENPRTKSWKDYGGRGITVCERWQTFANFSKDMGPRPSKDHTLERKDNSLGYFPGNVIWLHKSQQSQNTRKNHNITIDGVTKCLAEWSRDKGIQHQTVSARIHQMGWDPIRAILTPARIFTWHHKPSLPIA
jgi:hypothetical protein